MRDTEIEDEAKRITSLVGFISLKALEIEFEHSLEIFYLQGIKDAQDAVGEWNRP